MKMLYLLRHAETENGADDFNRPLTPRGYRQAQALATLLQAHLPQDAALAASDALRVRETLAPTGFGERIRLEHPLYLAPAKTLLSRIHAANAKTMLIAAHNPGLAELASYLAEENISFSPATLVVFESDAALWEDIAPENSVLKKVHDSKL